MAEPRRTTADSRRGSPAVPGHATVTWLLGPTVQLGGHHDGAVSGWCDDDGRPAFFYPEIAGYFLGWLAYRARLERSWRGTGREIAARTVRWLERLARTGDLPTRIPAVPSPDDWRNRATFLFDAAMLVRGLAAARRWLGVAPAPALASRLASVVTRASAGGAVLAPCLPSPGALLPDTWSTRPGAYQLKVIAALRGGGLALRRDTSEILASTTRAFARADCLSSDGELHPLMYALEGLLLLSLTSGDAAGLRLARDALRTAARERGPELGLGPAEPPSNARSDVIAQALRLGAALAACGEPALRPRELDAIAEALRGFVREDGAVAFRLEAGGSRHWNTWCALFADQALTFWALGARGALRPSLVASLV